MKDHTSCFCVFVLFRGDSRGCMAGFFDADEDHL